MTNNLRDLDPKGFEDYCVSKAIHVKCSFFFSLSWKVKSLCYHVHVHVFAKSSFSLAGQSGSIIYYTFWNILLSNVSVNC